MRYSGYELTIENRNEGAFGGIDKVCAGLGDFYLPNRLISPKSLDLGRSCWCRKQLQNILICIWRKKPVTFRSRRG
jgi:hypothetical protein